MEKTKQIPLIALAVFSIVILLANGNIDKVYALSVSQVGVGNLGASGLNVVYMASIDRYVLNFGSGVIKLINPTTHAVSEYTLSGLAPDNTWNAGIYCDTTYCYTSSFGAGNPDHIHQFAPLTGTTIEKLTVGATGDGTDIEIAGAEAIGTSVLDNSRLDDGWHMASCETGGFRVIFKISGEQIGVCNASGISGTLIAVEQIGNSLVTTASVATNALRVFSLATFAQTCVANINLSSGALGTMVAYSSSAYIVTATTTVSKYDTSCVAGTGITNHGLTTAINGLTPVENQGVFGIRSTTTVAFMNITSANISVLSYSVSLNNTDTQTTHRRNTMPLATEFNQLGTAIDTSTASDVFVFITLAESDDDDDNDGSSGATNGICNNGTALDCVGGNNSVGGLAVLTAPFNATTIGNTIGQGVGIVDPNNDDVTTNGVGLAYMLMMGVFFAGTLASTISALNKKGWVNMTAKEIDPIFWLFLVVGVVSASFYLGWIPDIVFYGMIVGLAGLLTLGVLKQIGRL